MPKGIPIDTQALPLLNNIEMKLISLPEEENNERIKRLARKILRVLESDRGNRPATGEDLFSSSSLEQDLAI
jgi:hypothetical protein